MTIMIFTNTNKTPLQTAFPGVKALKGLECCGHDYFCIPQPPASSATPSRCCFLTTLTLCRRW